MVDRVSKYVLELGGDDADLRGVFAGLKSRVRSDVAELKSITDKVDLFGAISDNLPKISTALDSAKAKVKQFTDEIEKIKASGEKAPKELIAGLAAAEKAANSASKEFNAQAQRLNELQGALSKAGVNTKQLASEQIRLAEASKVAADAAGVMAAKQALGLTTLKDVAPEVARLRAQFDLLKKSGTLSATEVAAAQRLLNGQIKELNASVSATPGLFKQLGEHKRTFTDLVLPITAAVGAITGLVAGLVSIVGAAKNVQLAVARVGTVTDLSKDQLAGLSSEARKLAVELGIDVVDALKLLYDIIRSGVPANNALEVLRAGALAAKAAITDTANGVKAATVLIDAFGVDAGPGLVAALDKIVRSGQSGGATLQEFADHGAQLGNVMRATGRTFEEILPPLHVMVDASNDAGGSMTVLTRILVNMNKPEVRDVLHKLGLDTKSLVEQLRGLEQANFKINDFLDLGIANTKAAAGISALINEIDRLPEAAATMETATGTVTKAVNTLADTAIDKQKKLGAAYEDAKVSLGNLLLSESELIPILTAGFKKVAEGIEWFDRYKSSTQGVVGANESVSGSYAGLGAAIKDALPTTADFAKEVANATKALEDSARALVKKTAVVRTELSAQIAGIRERAEIEIALLDRSTKAQAESAAKALEIRAKANADIIAAETEVQKVLTAATEAAIKDRTALEQKRIVEGKGNEKVFTEDISKIRLAGLNADLLNARKFQKDLIAEREAVQQRLNAIEQSRVSFAEGIEAAIRNIKTEGLTGLEQYEQKQSEVDRLIAEGRKTAASQGIQAAEKYFQSAKTLSESLRVEVKEDNRVVQDAETSQEIAIKNLRKIQNEYERASSSAREKDKEAFQQLTDKLRQSGETVDGLQKQFAALRKEATDEIVLTIANDISGIEAASAKIAELVKPETKVITVVTQGAGAGMHDGGPVGRFASGGPVFRRPSWSKVPGSGSGDTVPALLPEGSFIMRKAAAQRYGDSAMGRLARGYAFGGRVDVSGDSAATADLFKKATMSTPDISPTPPAGAALEYSRWIAAHIPFGGPLNSVRQDIGQLANLLERHPKDEALIQKVIRSARLAASNLPIENYWLHSVAGSMFASALPDWEEFAAKRKERVGPWWTWAQQKAEGGPIGPPRHIPAWVEPGEFYFSPPAVKRLGGGFLNALNSMQIPPPRLPSFERGGPVVSVPERGTLNPQIGRGGGTTINIYGAPPDFANESTVRRMLLPALREIERRSGTI